MPAPAPPVTQRKGGAGSWEVLAGQEPHLHAGLRLEGDGPGRVLGGRLLLPLNSRVSSWSPRRRLFPNPNLFPEPGGEAGAPGSSGPPC